MSLASTERPLADGHDAVILDLDGVVYVSAHPVVHAVPVLTGIARSGVRLAYVTNNAARTPESVAAQLREFGLPAPVEHVVTSAQAIAQVLAHDLSPAAPVLVVGGDGLVTAVREVGLVPVHELSAEPAAVVQGYSPDIAWSDLAEVAYAVQSGLPWYVSNTDSTIPTSRGIAPGNGSLVQAVQNATRTPPVAIAGKPYRPLFDATLDRLGIERALMVGDRLDTDIAGARGAGVASLAVLTGVSTLDDLIAAAPDHRPDFVAPDLRGLQVPHPPVQVDGSTARCGGAVAAFHDGTVAVLEAGQDGVERLRAVVGLAWSIGDACGRPPRLDGTLVA